MATLDDADSSHQWIFVTDTTDAAFPPEHYSPEALVDRLAEILLESAMSTKVCCPDAGIPTDCRPWTTP